MNACVDRRGWGHVAPALRAPRPIHCWLEDKPVGTGQGGEPKASLVEEAQVAKGHRAEVRSHPESFREASPARCLGRVWKDPKGKEE